MKKRISLIIALCLLVPSLVLGANADEDATFAVAGFNTYRSADSIIIYNQSGEYTQTNQWGYEVCVDSDGVIVSVGGNNRQVPVGGFVISGHGTAAAELRACAKVGRHARYFEKPATVIISDSFIPPFFTAEYPFNGVNTIRRQDYIVVYNWSGSTNTNQWGYEVCVDSQGTVISVGGNNNAIPEGGFVVSGHGDGADLLQLVMTPGLHVEYDAEKLILSVSYTIESMIFNACSALDTHRETLDSLNARFALEDESVFRTLETYSAELDSEVKKYRDGRITSLELAEFIAGFRRRLDSDVSQSDESLPFEYRGVWLRPRETSRAAVHEVVTRLHDMGVNMISIETQYACCTVFPMPEGSLIQQNPSFKGFDALQAYIEECHALGMELHCWMPVYYLGSSDSVNADIAVFAKRLDLFARNQDNNYYDEDGGSFMMLDPSNPDAKAFLLEFYEYLLTNYDIDCLQLDYIRYIGPGAKYDWGYHTCAAETFKAKYGFYPTYDQSAPWWNDWCQIRCDCVTDFVRSVRALIDEKAPGVLLSADVYSDLSTTKTSVYQDSARWVKEGLLDILHPMTYGVNTPYVQVPSFAELCKGRCVLAPGMGAYLSSVDPDVLYGQIAYLRRENVFGGVTFESTAFLTKAQGGKICGGLYAEPAPSPLREPAALADSANAFFAARLSRAKKSGDLTASEYGKLVAALNAATEAIKTGDGVPEAAQFLALCKSSGSARAKSAFTPYADMFRTAAQLAAKQKTADAGYIYIPEKTRPEELAAYLPQGASYVCGGAGRYAGTGCELLCRDASGSFKATVIVYGDTNGDGVVGPVDYAMIKRTYLGTYSLEGAKLAAAIVSGGAKLRPTDYARVKRHVLGTYDLFGGNAK